MSTITLPVPDDLLADLREIAQKRETTVEEEIVNGLAIYCREVQRPRYPDNVSAVEACVPAVEDREDDDINGYKAYYEYMERKHR